MPSVLALPLRLVLVLLSLLLRITKASFFQHPHNNNVVRSPQPLSSKHQFMISSSSFTTTIAATTTATHHALFGYYNHRNNYRHYNNYAMMTTQSTNNHHDPNEDEHRRNSLEKSSSSSRSSNYLTSDNTNNNTSSYPRMIILGICGGIGSGKSTACQLMVTKLGCAGLIDADKLAHTVYDDDDKLGSSVVLDEIIHEFGTDILLRLPMKEENDNNNNRNNNNNDDDRRTKRTIDRKKLGAIVFQDAKSMSKLERIVWPHVRTKIEESIRNITLKGDRKLIHKELLTEHNIHNGTDHDCDDDNVKINNSNIIIVEAALLLETDWHDLLDGLWIIHSSEDVAKLRLMQHRGMTEEEALLRIHAQQTRKGIGIGDGIGDGSSGSGRDAKYTEWNESLKNNGIVTATIANNGSLDELETILKETLNNPKSFKQKKDLQDK